MRSGYLKPAEVRKLGVHDENRDRPCRLDGLSECREERAAGHDEVEAILFCAPLDDPGRAATSQQVQSFSGQLTKVRGRAPGEIEPGVSRLQRRSIVADPIQRYRAELDSRVASDMDPSRCALPAAGMVISVVEVLHE